MAETQNTSRETSETPSTQTAAEDALMNVRSEILKQISSELDSKSETQVNCSGSGFAKYVSHTKI
jgi:hypothetical protein